MVNAARLVTLESAGGTIQVETARNLPAAVHSSAGVSGLGLPPRLNHWFEGAGPGATYRGSRALPRTMRIPLKVTGVDELDLLDRLSRLAQVVDPDEGQVRYYRTFSGVTWWVDVVREGGGDIVSGDFTSTDLRTYANLDLVFTAGDPFWTRVGASQQVIRAAGLGRGLLGTGRSLTMMRLSSGQAMGEVLVENPGDAPAWTTTTLVGPGTALDLVSPRGEVIHWDGALTAGQRRIFDHQHGTLVDPDDPDPETANKYHELATAPRFWSLPSGTSRATVELEGATTDSSVTLSWLPRRRLVI